MHEFAGPTRLRDRYSEQLRAINRAKGRKGNTKEFTPAWMKRFIQTEVAAFNHENKDNPGFVPFTAHNFRDTAMTRAWDAGIDLDLHNGDVGVFTEQLRILQDTFHGRDGWHAWHGWHAWRVGWD